MPFRILKIKFPKGAWRKPLFYIFRRRVFTVFLCGVGIIGILCEMVKYVL